MVTGGVELHDLRIGPNILDTRWREESELVAKAACGCNLRGSGSNMHISLVCFPSILSRFLYFMHREG